MRQLVLKNTTPSLIAERVLSFKGMPYSLRDYPMFREIYDTPIRHRVIRAGRQVSKTVTLAGDITITAATTPYLPMIYANSSGAQTTSFSTSKLDPFLLHSKVIYSMLMNSRTVINNIFNKRFKNMSELRLSFLSESADRLRGSTGFPIYFDEVQDMLYEAMIDAEECASAANGRYPRFMYAGTSKSMNTPLEFFWSISTMKQWIIKCNGCNRWNIPDKKNIGSNGIICKRCAKPLDTRQGMWMPTCDGDAESKMHDGFHVPQIIMPMHTESADKWKVLLHKLENYPEWKFDNEVMGFPIGDGEQPITEQMLRDACIDGFKMDDHRNEANSGGAGLLVAGIDWGGGGTSGLSRTALAIFAVYPDRPADRLVYGKIFSGGEPTKHIEEIAYTLKRFGVLYAYGDHGGGNFAMSQLAQLTPGIRIIPVMYTDQAAPYSWSETAARFTVNRTTMIDSFFVDLKKRRMDFYEWESFLPFAKDILNVRVEYVGEEQGKTRRMWRHFPAKPDDALHAMVFGWFGTRVARGDMDFSYAASL